jgi:hypothetical protein
MASLLKYKLAGKQVASAVRCMLCSAARVLQECQRFLSGILAIREVACMQCCHRHACVGCTYE